MRFYASLLFTFFLWLLGGRGYIPESRATSSPSCNQVFTSVAEPESYFFYLATSFSRGYLPDLSNPQEKQFFHYYLARFLGTPYPSRDPEADLKWREYVSQYGLQNLQKKQFPLGKLTFKKREWKMTAHLQTLLQDFRQTMVKLKTPFFNPIANIHEWKIMLEDPNFEFPEKFVTSWQSSKGSAFHRLKLIHNLLKSLRTKYSKEGLPIEALQKAEINLFRVWPLTVPLYKLPDLKDPHQDPIRQMQHYLQFRDQIFENETIRTNFDRWASQLGSQTSFQYENEKFRKRLLREIEQSLELSPPNVQLDSVWIRQLSLMEAPERSNLGLDCSGCQYWETALNPNYQYFTLMNDQFYSNGVITLVLGTAKTNRGEIENIAFIDKVQNVPIPMILNFIEGLRQILSAEGYTLAMSKHLNQNRDDVLSNDKELQEYLLQHLTLDKRFSYRNFHQHPTNMKFQDGLSRAKHAGYLRRVLPRPLNPSEGVELIPTPSWKFFHDEFPAIPELLTKTYQLKYGNEQDKLAYLHIQNTMTKDVDPEFLPQLKKFIHDPDENLSVRRKAFWILSLRQEDALSASDFRRLSSKFQSSMIDAIIQSEIHLESFDRYPRPQLLVAFYEVAVKENWKFLKKKLETFFALELFQHALHQQDLATMEALWTEENSKLFIVNQDQTQTAMIECVENDLFLSAQFLLQKHVDPLQTRRYLDKKNALTRAAFLKKSPWILFFQQHGISLSGKDGNNDSLWTSFLKGRPSAQDVIEFKKVLPWKDEFLQENPQILKYFEILGPDVTQTVTQGSPF